MAASESSEGPPDNATSPPGTSGTIVTSELQTALSNLNDNMTSMAHILELIYKERCPPGNDNMKTAAPTGDSNSPPPHERPPKRVRVESAGEYRADEEDSLSVTTSDNLENDNDALVNPTSATTKLVFEGQRQEVLAELAKTKQTVSKFEEFVPSLREYYHWHV